MKRESHQLRLTNEGNYLPLGYFLLVLTKNIFSGSEGLEAHENPFISPVTLLQNGPLRIWCTGKRESVWAVLRGQRSTGVRNTGVRSPGVRSQSKPMKNTVTLRSAPSDRGLELTKARPGSAQGWCCLCLAPELLFRPSHQQVTLQPEGGVSSPSGFHVPTDLALSFPCTAPRGWTPFCHHHCPCVPTTAGDNQAGHGVGNLLTQLFDNLWFA